MPTGYLHDHPDFPELLRILETETDIQAYLIEKDYWIMHVLYGLQKQQFSFELKGGTSLSKGFKLIHRFSEDIDIQIHPPPQFTINENPKNANAKNIAAKKEFYDWLAENIQIDGIMTQERDTSFDDPEGKYRSGGIRLYYTSKATPLPGIKEGILLEVGFDTVRPNQPVVISSWAYDRAGTLPNVPIIDNRALDVTCYNPEYTFVEKLQTIATKYRKEQEGVSISPNFMRQYYDVYCLLGDPQVQGFIGSQQYHEHKQKRFPKTDMDIPAVLNQAFLLELPEIRTEYERRYKATANLYYQGQPPFEALLARIKQYLPNM